VDGLNLAHHAHIALAVALGADDAHRRLMDQIRIGAEHAGNAHGLGGAARMMINVHNGRFADGGRFLHGRIP
jgi:hypothetical protein